MVGVIDCQAGARQISVDLVSGRAEEGCHDDLDVSFGDADARCVMVKCKGNIVSAFAKID